MKKIYVASDAVNAHVLRELLESHSIAAVVQDERIFALRGEVPVVYATVWVKDEQADAARALARQFEQSAQQAPAAEAWACPKCGERIDGQFSACWKCEGDEERQRDGAAAVSEGAVRSRSSREVFLVIALILVAALYLFFRNEQQRGGIPRPLAPMRWR